MRGFCWAGVVGVPVLVISSGLARGGALDGEAGIAWSGDRDQALRRAQEADLPVLAFLVQGDPFASDCCPGSNVMARVTYRDPGVAALVSGSFVPYAAGATKGSHWMGLDFFAPRADPAARTRDEQETARARRLATIAPSGLAADKFATIVATPAGEVLHVIPGYLPAQALCDELAFARDLYRSLRDAPAAARPRLVSEAHRARAARLEGAAADPTGVGLRRHVHELLARQPLPPLRAAQPRHFIRHDLVAKALQRFSADLHKVQRDG